MTPTDLCYTPAAELVRLIRTHAVSPVEVTRAVLERIERVYGVPVSIKNLSLTRGVRTMAASVVFEHRVPDAPFVRRLRAAGAISLGKTTTPEFGWKGLGDSPSPARRATRGTPRRRSSRGGGGGWARSRRAATARARSASRPPCCGIYGLKPSYGRVPMWPVSNDDYGLHVGPMTRTMADAALMLAAITGPDDWDHTSLEARPADYVGALGHGLAGCAWPGARTSAGCASMAPLPSW